MALNLSLHKRQSEAFVSPATEILYGGAAGGGKSHLIRVLATILATEVKGLQIYLFRRLSDDLYKNHMEGAGGFYSLLNEWFDSKLVKFNGQKNVIEFWNKSKIWLSHCQYEKNLIKYQGPEIHVLLIDELTHFTESMYRFLRGRLRLGDLKVPEKWKAKLPLVLCGTNPGGIGHNWVKKMFISMAKPMQCRRMSKKEGGMLRQYVPAKLEDNPTLIENDPDYVDRLEGLGNDALVKAMKDGDWDLVMGGAFDDVWDRNKLVVPRFKIPHSWRIDRSFDWGSTHPFSCGWWAESDGTEAELPDGSTFCPPKGSLIRIYEWYGCKEGESNKGLKLSAKKVAEGISEREAALKKGGWIKGDVKPGPADNEISAVKEKDSGTIADRMESVGVRWTKSDKSPGSRINGLELARERMLESLKDNPEDPAIYFMDECLATIELLPVLPRDEDKPDDVDTDAEDHVWDDIRYKVLASKPRAMDINMGFAS